ncbi:MAG: sigma-70 family RNA polymerase sigma factor [Candidatus Latescibacterota bacterium]|nr:MAG: sigma-70 family RNA polymerase sigma factor [Candidatus Latescibacterota bacterium]
MQKQDTKDDIELESIDLAKSFLAGDRRSFDRLIMLHKRLVFNLCYRSLGDYDEADDCAQDVFIKVSRSLKDFRFGSRFTTWLYRITVNTCKNRIGSLEYRLRSRTVRIDTERDMDDKPKVLEIENHRHTPVVEFAKKEIDHLIQCAVNTLPAKQRLVVVLRDIEGRSYKEIGEIMGFELGTVKSTLSRAREQLRELLKGKI